MIVLHLGVAKHLVHASVLELVKLLLRVASAAAPDLIPHETVGSEESTGQERLPLNTTKTILPPVHAGEGDGRQEAGGQDASEASDRMELSELLGVRV